MDLPKRKAIRLPEYDYAQCGAYFLTLCTENRRSLFWSVGAAFGRPPEQPPLSHAGQIVASEIEKIHTIYPSVSILKYCIMPDHVHLLVVMEADADGRPKAAPTVSRMVQQFKGSISKQLGQRIWQKSFYDHVIRNEADYLACWEYIDENPAKWKNNDW